MFHHHNQLYFVSFATVNWVDVFVRRIYCDIMADSLRFCIENKGLELYAWCIMSSHVHLIISTETGNLSDIMRDMKKHTSVALKTAIKSHPAESRREWMLGTMYKAGKDNINNKDFQFWMQHNHPIELSSNNLLDERLNYIHMNPVVAGFVDQPEAWLYSSARDYAGVAKGKIDLIFIE